jgi:hypothetical protein
MVVQDFEAFQNLRVQTHFLKELLPYLVVLNYTQHADFVEALNQHFLAQIVLSKFAHQLPSFFPHLRKHRLLGLALQLHRFPADQLSLIPV